MTYRVTKTIEIAGAHMLALPYISACSRLHGHNWLITVTCEAKSLSEQGMVMDFSRISAIVKSLDHCNLNDFIPQPTAERIAEWLLGQIPNCVEVTVQESHGNSATVSAD
jgi:6-pyruvoyltetrahydropterin/6-carboxytetrahydropterin synthase